MPLDEYRRKRDFARTAEPAGRRARKAPPKRTFVVQKHAASRLHYDFRLEFDGVLKSWAVPKGPSLDPTVKSLAVEVEDHPIEYGNFEGTIPHGQYGGGTVLLWDRGHWTPTSDPKTGFQNGRLRFELHGDKLAGAWNLVRMRSENGKPQWLLMKSRDAAARPRSDYDVLAERPESVKTGRDLGDIAASGKAVWTSGRKADVRRKKRPPARSAARRSSASPPAGTAHVENARRESTVRWRPPQLAQLVDAAPEGDNWAHEVKYDGYRLLALLRNGEVRLLTRNEKDWTARFRPIATALRDLPAAQALLDGEVVVLNRKGVSDFQALQNVLESGKKAQLYYFAFDLLHLNGYDLTAAPLLDRKKLLQALLPRSASSNVRFSDHVLGDGAKVFRAACRRGLEGIISKRADAPYESRRSHTWVKVKCTASQECVIGGYTDPAGARTGFGALLLGVHADDGSLRYCGRVGTGFDARRLTELTAQLRKLETRHSPFATPPRGPAARGVHWVKPELVAQVQFANLTRDGILRHPSFQGLRMDKPAEEVVQESPAKRAQASRATSHRRRTNAGAKKQQPSRVSPRTTSADSAELAGVTITHPGRVLYPGAGVTKGDLAQYYVAIADAMLPHVLDRPLMLVRCPAGVEGACFHQKHPGSKIPAGLRGVPIREMHKTETYMVVEDVRGLVSLVQMGALEIHTWGSRAANLENPDVIIFDLDPGPGVKWASLVAAAIDVRDRLHELGLASFVKTSGGKGLHVMVPIRPVSDWDRTKAFARAVAGAMVQLAPTRYVDKMTKALRPGKIYMDYLRNGRGSTCAAAYSARARPAATVSCPLTWRELKATKDPAEWTIKTVPARVRKRGDPWPEFWNARQSLPPGEF